MPLPPLIALSKRPLRPTAARLHHSNPGSTAAWPLAARGARRWSEYSIKDNIGGPLAARVRGFRQGLRDSGFVEGENVAIEYRWAENKIERLPELVTDLLRRRLRRLPQPVGR
jgi:putative ABC transport system substrate-binding protein